METLLGIKGKDFVMLAADKTQINSIFVLKDGKIYILELFNLQRNLTCGKDDNAKLKYFY